MDYQIQYHIKGHNRADILKGLPFLLSITHHADTEDKDFVEDIVKWMNVTGRTVVRVMVPTSCDTCSGWTMQRESIYSPTYKKSKR